MELEQILSTGEVPSVESLNDWDGLPVPVKQAFLQSMLVRHKKNFDFISEFLSERVKFDYLTELSFLLGMLAAVESEDGVERFIARLANLEDVFSREMPALIHKKAQQDIQSLEKGLAVAAGIIPPEKITAIREQVDSIRQVLPDCTKAEQFDDVIERLQAARVMLSN